MTKVILERVCEAKTIGQINAVGRELLDEAQKQGLLGSGLSPEQKRQFQKFWRLAKILALRRERLTKTPARVLLPKAIKALAMEKARKRRAKRHS